MESGGPSRRLFIGAEVQPGGGVHFRVWAPRCQHVEVVVDCEPPGGGQLVQVSQSLKAEPGGFYSTNVERAKVGDLYRFRLDGENQLYPDPASRFQPQGSAGPSQVVDPSLYAWHDQAWRGVQLHGQIAYELHVGTFTKAGTWQAAAGELEELARFGITLLEVMPVAEFPGRFGWGYDGVDLFAPTRLYGSPDDFRTFVDRAHELGLGVILDVVYNHFGPVDNYLGKFSDDFVSRRHVTEWGSAVNFDGENCGPVREFFSSNAAYWIDEYHLDGLRLDAIHAIEDDSEEHIVAALTRRAREKAAGRSIIVIAENEHQEAKVVRGVEEGGYGLDATWNDDFHHAVRVASTGHNDFFYGDYRGSPQELLSAVKRGFLYQGQWNRRQGKRRGSPTWGLPAERFVTFLENHDQVAHSGRGERPRHLTSPGRFRAVTVLWLLAPGTPMFFQGQEFWASAPFMFFADHDAELAALVRKGRHDFLKNFYSLTGRDSETAMADPADIETFNRCKLDFSERETHRETYLMHRELLRLRREDPVFASQRSDRVEGAVLGAEALLLRYRGEREDRLLLVNLGCTFDCDPASEPLLAPPVGDEWQLLWSSEDPRFGGAGTGLADEKHWRVPGHAALVFCSAQAGSCFAVRESAPGFP